MIVLTGTCLGQLAIHRVQPCRQYRSWNAKRYSFRNNESVLDRFVPETGIILSIRSKSLNDTQTVCISVFCKTHRILALWSCSSVLILNFSANRSVFCFASSSRCTRRCIRSIILSSDIPLFRMRSIILTCSSVGFSGSNGVTLRTPGDVFIAVVPMFFFLH